VLDIEVEQRRFDAEHHDAGNRLVVRMTLHVGGTLRAGDASEAEMRLPGRAWLEFEVTDAEGGSIIRQTAVNAGPEAS
jgi:hypothetical protein